MSLLKRNAFLNVLRKVCHTETSSFKHTFVTTGVTPVPDRYHTPSSDGCGSLGLEIKSDHFPIGAMTKCCDQHDICYDTCKSNKELCDVEFRRCLYKYCDTHKKLLGELIIKGNLF